MRASKILTEWCNLSSNDLIPEFQKSISINISFISRTVCTSGRKHISIPVSCVITLELVSGFSCLPLPAIPVINTFNQISNTIK